MQVQGLLGGVGWEGVGVVVGGGAGEDGYGGMWVGMFGGGEAGGGGGKGKGVARGLVP